MVEFQFLLVHMTADLYLLLKDIEPQHDKTNTVTMRPAKTQISLSISPVWSDWAYGQADLRLHWVHSFCWFCHVVAHFKNYCAVEDSYFQKHWLVIT